MPDRYVLQLQVLRKLTVAGILKAYRGVRGGYRLGRPARQISLLDVVTAVEGPFETEAPEVLLASMTRASRDVLSRKLEDATTHAHKVMGDLTIDRLELSRPPRAAS